MQGVGITPVAGRQLANRAPHRTDGLDRQPADDPAIGAAGDAIETGRRAGREQQRRSWLLQRLRLHLDRPELDPRPGVDDGVVAPYRVEHVEQFLEAGREVPGGDADCCVGALGPPDTETDREASGARVVERRERPRQEDRCVPRADEDAGSDPDSFGGGGGDVEGADRVEDAGGRRVARREGGIHHPEGGVTGDVGGPSDLAHRGHVGEPPDLRDADPDAHLLPPHGTRGAW